MTGAGSSLFLSCQLASISSQSTCSRMLAQQATPPSETLPLPIPSNNSSSSDGSDLARRCRQLARSFGHGAVVEQQFVGQGSVRESHSHSPVRASPNTSPARSPRLTSSLFPLSPTGKIQPPLSPRSSSYPTPEGSFILSEIMEEEGGDEAAKSRRIAVPSGALSETETSDVEQGAKGRQGSRTGSRMTALNSLKLAGDSECRPFSASPPALCFLEPNRDLSFEQTWTKRCSAPPSETAFPTLNLMSGLSMENCW